MSVIRPFRRRSDRRDPAAFAAPGTSHPPHAYPSVEKDPALKAGAEEEDAMCSVRDCRVAQTLIDMIRKDLARQPACPSAGWTRLVIEMAWEAQSSLPGLDLPDIVRRDLMQLAKIARARARDARRACGRSFVHPALLAA